MTTTRLTLSTSTLAWPGVVLTGVLLVAPRPAIAEEASADSAPAASATDDGATPTVKTRTSKKHKKKKAPPAFHIGTWDGDIEARGAAVGGALSGRSTLRTRGGVVGVEAEATPALERDRWRLELPLTVGHRETPGTELRETRGGLDLEARWRRSPRLRVETAAGVRVVWRPGWLDEYQPTAGGLMTTDRYSHWDQRLSAAVVGIPVRHHHAKLEAWYRRVDHADDPSYDPIDAPTHLVPGDHDAIGLDGRWRYHGHGWKLGGQAELSRERWFQAYSRDAGTGLTHAGPGGLPPNPLYREVTFEPAALGSLELAGGAFDLGVSYGYQIVSDRFEGYYSSRAHHPELDLGWEHGKLELDLDVDLYLRTYGPDSYAAGPDHPALEGGASRRDDRKLLVKARTRWAARPS